MLKFCVDRHKCVPFHRFFPVDAKTFAGDNCDFKSIRRRVLLVIYLAINHRDIYHIFPGKMKRKKREIDPLVHEINALEKSK